MDDALQALEDLTQNFILRINDMDYEQIEKFVDEREEITQLLLSKLNKTPFTDNQKERLRELLKYDEIILKRMKTLKHEARDWNIRQNQIKAQSNAYDSDYAPDSILMDKRK